LANGRFDEAERVMLSAAASVWGLTVEPDAVEPIEPEELAARMKGKAAREHVVQACWLMSLSDQEASPEEWAVVSKLARALEVDEPRIKVLESLSKGHIRRARFHARRTMMKGARSQLNDATFGDLLRVTGVLPADEALVARFKALADLP